MNYKVVSMTEAGAHKIYNWHYPTPFSIYDMKSDEGEDLSELMNGEYYMLLNDEEVVGFYCFGKSAQVPFGNNFHMYDDKDYLDFGLGLNPDLCSQGKGFDFCEMGIDFLEMKFNLHKFRLSVFDFNERAIKVYHKSGFVIQNFFKAKTDHYFLVMTLERN